MPAKKKPAAAKSATVRIATEITLNGKRISADALEQHMLRTQASLTPPPTARRLQPKMIKLDSAGDILADASDKHAAIYLPEYQLVFATRNMQRAATWLKAKEMAKACSLFGRSDWTLPESNEAMLLIDHRFRRPACNPVFLGDMPVSDWVWTATELPPAQGESLSGVASCVHFNLGLVNWYLQNNTGFVLPVLRVAPGQF